MFFFFKKHLIIIGPKGNVIMCFTSSHFGAVKNHLRMSHGNNQMILLLCHAFQFEPQMKNSHSFLIYYITISNEH